MGVALHLREIVRHLRHLCLEPLRLQVFVLDCRFVGVVPARWACHAQHDEACS